MGIEERPERQIHCTHPVVLPCGADDDESDMACEQMRAACHSLPGVRQGLESLQEGVPHVSRLRQLLARPAPHAKQAKQALPSKSTSGLSPSGVDMLGLSITARTSVHSMSGTAVVSTSSVFMMIP